MQICPSQTQSFATANAKHCNCQRKALQPPTQSFAIANAKLCNRQLFATAPTNVYGKGLTSKITRQNDITILLQGESGGQQTCLVGLYRAAAKGIVKMKCFPTDP